MVKAEIFWVEEKNNFYNKQRRHTKIIGWYDENGPRRTIYLR